MPKNWNKGHTKHTHPSVLKISETMKAHTHSNFHAWQERMKLEGKMISTYPELVKNGDLSELIGVTLGDGHITVFPRCEELRIVSNAKNKGFIERYAQLIENVFGKAPSLILRRYENAVDIRLYQKHISSRLSIPSGNKERFDHVVPLWILENKEFIVRYLRGLYEAEGSFCVHEPTYTYKFLFANTNDSLLRQVFDLMKILGFHPHRSTNQVQISKREEVYKAMELLQFRKYK